MKTILISEIVEDNHPEEHVSVVIDGAKFEGCEIAKPLNYEKEYTSFNDRLVMARKVLTGKAIAVQFYSDLTEEEKIEHVKSKIV
jgi:hypothetical protein